MLKIKTKERVVKPYARLLLSYMIISAIIIMLFVVNYYNIANSIKDQKMNEALLSLQRATEIIDEQIAKTKQVLYNISLNDDMRYIASINTAPLPSQHKVLLDAQNFMAEFELASDIIDECAIVFNPESPFMLTTKQIVTNLDIYYNSELYKYYDMDYENYQSFIKSAVETNQIYGFFLPSKIMDLYNQKKIDVITFVLPLRMSGIKNPPVALVYINVENIKDLVVPFSSSSDGWLCIADSQGDILYNENYMGETLLRHSNSPQLFSLQNDSIMHVMSSKTNLAYYMSIPDNWVDIQMQPFRVAFYIMVSIALIIGIIISVVFAYYNVKPVSKIIGSISRRLSGIVESNDSFDYIQRSFDFLLDSNEQMTEKLKKWDPILKSGLYERLFKGGIINKQEYEVAPELMMISSNEFCVSVVEWKPYPGGEIKYNLNKLILFISESIKKYFEKVIIHPIDGESAAILFIKSEYKDIRMIIDKLQIIVPRLSDHYNLLFSIGIGGEYSELPLVTVSCFEAKRAITGIEEWHDCRVIKYELERQHIGEYDFPFEYMEKIYSYVIAGDIKSLEIIIEQIYKKNFCNKMYDDREVEHFYDDLMRILDKVSSELPIEHIISTIPRLTSFSDALKVFNHCLEIFDEAVNVSKEKKTEASEKLAKVVYNYIEENYNDPDISLQSIAMKFRMSDKYMSIFIKEKTGNNFSKILEDKRLSKATQLLSETNKSINEIYQSVGYSSDNTFYRAFRRKFGVSPTRWRSKQKE